MYFFFLEEVHLRHVEKDVLIPKLMREKAKELCAEKVQGVSAFWNIIWKKKQQFK